MAKLLVIITGSIAAYKACDAISRLVQRGHQVRTVLTESAAKFVGAATLEGLTGEPARTDLFAAGQALDHIELTRWADAVMICPATAHTLNRAAAGLGDDLAGALLLAHDWRKPLIVAPAMNPAMWSHPATVASVEKLKSWGARFVPVGLGRTACGEVGEGRLAEPAEIVAFIEAILTQPTRRLRVLITSGGTTEPVDGVRVLTNTSTGATGALLAEHFAGCGHEVTLLRAQNAHAASAPVRQETFTSFASLDAALGRLLGEHEFDAVIHAAAVSDFSVGAIETEAGSIAGGAGKIESAGDVILRLKRNPKLIDRLRARSRNPALRVIGFKLTRDATDTEIRAAVDALRTRTGVDLVVHNDLAWRTADGAFPAAIWPKAGEPTHCATRAELATALEKWLVAAEK